MRILRASWVLLAIGFVLYFVITRWTTVVAIGRTLDAWQLIASLGLIVAGKLVYVMVVRLTLGAVQANAGFNEAFYSYNISQLGKYIPGSIWQFVGRYEIYRRYGVTPSQAFQIMVLENGLMVITALLIGLGAAPVFADVASRFLTPGLLGGIAIALLAALTGMALVKASRARIRAALETLWKRRALVAGIAALFMLMWVLLGLSALAIFVNHVSVSPFFMIALFAISFAAGFTALFAPAGIGVRDVVFTIGLTHVVEPQVALLLTVAHRLVYILADLLCGLVAWTVMRRIGPNAV